MQEQLEQFELMEFTIPEDIFLEPPPEIEYIQSVFEEIEVVEEFDIMPMDEFFEDEYIEEVFVEEFIPVDVVMVDMLEEASDGGGVHGRYSYGGDVCRRIYRGDARGVY